MGEVQAKDRAAAAAAQWRDERPDIDASAMELVGRLAELALVIGRDHVQPLFSDLGLGSGEFDVLATLRRSGAPYALTPTALYEAAMMSSGGMTARLDRLEQAGLIARQPHPSDRRGTLVALTPAGLALIDRALPLHVANLERVLAPLGAAQRRQLGELLTRWLAGLQSGGEPAASRRRASAAGRPTA